MKKEKEKLCVICKHDEVKEYRNGLCFEHYQFEVLVG